MSDPEGKQDKQPETDELDLGSETVADLEVKDED